MKSYIAIAIASLGICWNSAALAQSSFVLTNKTGETIKELYFSPSHKSRWGADVLNGKPLKHGESLTWSYKKSDSCDEDLKVVFADGDEVEWDEIDVCESPKLSIKYNRKTGKVSVE